MQNYFKPIIIKQAVLKNLLVAQYAFVFLEENCEYADVLSEVYQFNEDTLVTCAEKDFNLDSDVAFTFTCLGFSGSYVLMTDVVNLSKVIDSSDCVGSKSGPDLVTIPVSVNPSLPGNCLVTSMYREGVQVDYCDLEENPPAKTTG